MSWKSDVSPYEKPSLKRSVWQLINTLVPFFLLWTLAYFSLSVSYWLTLAFIVPAALFLVRIFILFHDCCHKSFFKSLKANEIVGTITGILTCTPYFQWRYSHAVHHATCSNLDRRGIGDIWMLTVDEYLALSKFKRLVYRAYRNPLIMVVLGPIYIFLIDYRFNRKDAKLKERMNTYLTNIFVVGIGAFLCWLIGWQEFLMIQGPIFLISGIAGVWMFYVQHQYDGTYYEREGEWDFVKAALEGSSFYKLPKILQWFTGNIGYHHVHHLSGRIPNYLLELAHKDLPFLQNVKTFTLKTSFQTLPYRLWDEQKKKLIGFKEMRVQN